MMKWAGEDMYHRMATQKCPNCGRKAWLYGGLCTRCIMEKYGYIGEGE